MEQSTEGVIMQLHPSLCLKDSYTSTNSSGNNVLSRLKHVIGTHFQMRCAVLDSIVASDRSSPALVASPSHMSSDKASQFCLRQRQLRDWIHD
jgi:hypothetical protein